MNITPEVLMWVGTGVASVIAYFIKELKGNLKATTDSINILFNKLSVLDTRVPTPEQLQNSISAIGARVGDLENYKAVTQILLDNMAHNLSETNIAIRELSRTMQDIQQSIVRIETKLGESE